MNKFRAWYHKHEAMYSVASIDLALECITVLEDDYVFGFEEVVFMLYSDLFDKNNVNICDGDITKNHIDELWVVKYHRGAFRYYAINRFKHLFSDGIFETDNLGNFSTKNFEVLGNIYENPELLEVSEW